MTGRVSAAIALALALGCAPAPDASEPRAVSEKEFLNLPYRSQPNGFTHVVTSPPGKMVFLSGAGGTDRDGTMPEDFSTQGRNTFQHLQAGLELAGATFDDVVKINYYLKDMADLADLREVRAKYLNMDAPPAATAVQVGLSGKMLLEIDLIAVVSE